MTVSELKKLLDQYPENWSVFVNCENVEKVEPIEGTTSDGPGSLNIQGDNQ